MTELERVRRLPVFIDEEQWSRAYEAAYRELKTIVYSQLYDEDPLAWESNVLRSLATRIATAALRAAAQDDEGDISDIVDVRVAQIPSSTPKPSPPAHPRVENLHTQTGRIEHH